MTSYLEDKRKRNIYLLVCVCLLLSAFAVSIKRVFVGYDVDEQYALALVYRLYKGDMFLKELWEPHQFSAIIAYFPFRIFVDITGGTEHAVIFMRLVGTLFLLCVYLCWYSAFKELFGKYTAFVSACIFFFILPKYIVSPEFANVQLWLSVLLCLSAISADKSGKIGYYLLSGFFLTLETLVYPSCGLLFFLFFFYFMKNKKGLAAYVVVPTVSFCGLMVYLRQRMTFAEMATDIRYILADGSHSSGLLQKICGYISEIPELLVYVCVYGLLAFFIAMLIKRDRKEFGIIFAMIWTGIAGLDQLRFWYIVKCPNVHPQYFFLIMYVAGIIIYKCVSEETRERWKKPFRIIYSCSFVCFISVLILTNLDLKSAFVHLSCGCVMAFMMGADLCINKRMSSDTRAEIPIYVCLAVFLLVNIFGQLTLVRINNEGTHEDISMVRQKALYGPAAGVYCEYMDGYKNNEDHRFLSDTLPRGSKIIYLGNSPDKYLMGDYTVCSPSTISTPTFDGRVLDYFKMNPEKYPEYILIEKKSLNVTQMYSEEFLQWMHDAADEDSVIESDNLTVYKVVR